MQQSGGNRSAIEWPVIGRGHPVWTRSHPIRKRSGRSLANLIFVIEVFCIAAIDFHDIALINSIWRKRKRVRVKKKGYE